METASGSRGGSRASDPVTSAPRYNMPDPAEVSIGPALTARAGGGPEADYRPIMGGAARILANARVSGGRAGRVFPTPAERCRFGDALARLRRRHRPRAPGAVLSGFRPDKLLPAARELGTAEQRDGAVWKQQSPPFESSA